MIKRTLHYLWGKKFFFLLFALLVILLPNAINRDLQIRTATVLTEITIERNGDEITITAEKFKPGEQGENAETVTFQGTNVREMLADVSLAHCKKITFPDEPDLVILHELYHFQDLRGNTPVNDGATIGEILKSHDCYCQ